MEVLFESEGIKVGDKSNIMESDASIKKPMLNCISLGSTECYDENQNSISIKQIVQTINSDTLFAEEESNSSVDRMNKSFNELQIEPLSNENIESNNKNKHMAGKISSIISAMNVVLVQALSAETLLYIGTPLFTSYKVTQNNDVMSYVLLGRIDDILGNIGDPIYSVNLENKSPTLLDIGEQVYYFSNDPSTQLAHVEHTLGTGFNKIQYKIRIKDSW